MTETVRPFLMFVGDAEPAMTFYVSLFPDGRIEELTRFGAGEGGVEGAVKRGRFSIGGQTILCSDSPDVHAFGFTPSSSLFVECESEARLMQLLGALVEHGDVLMPPDNYGFSQKFAWVSDRFGVSWQLNLA